MTVHKMKRFCFRDPEEVESGDECIACNFEQLLPHTSILVGKTSIVFRECRLVNCDVPGDAIVDRCLHQHLSCCTNIEPERIALGQTACAQQCSHVSDTDEVRIDGVLIDTIYHYEHQVVA